MYTHETSTSSRPAVVTLSSNSECKMQLATPLHESSFTTAQQDVKYDATATSSRWVALLKTDRVEAGKSKIVKAESSPQGTVHAEVLTPDATPAMTYMEIQKLVAPKTKRSGNEMIINDVP